MLDTLHKRGRVARWHHALAWLFLAATAACSRAGREAPETVVFLGDSLTVYLRVTDISPGAQNYAFGGATTADLLARLHEYPLQQARMVVLTIGTNDVLLGRTDGIDERLQAISAAIPGPLAWHAVPPQAGRDVEAVNSSIQRLCERHRDCTFIRTRFAPGDFDPDGIHLSPAGYARWAASLKAALENRAGRGIGPPGLLQGPG